MKIFSFLVVLAGLALSGCGSPKSADGKPLDSNRPPTPSAPTGNGMSVPPPTAAPATTTGG